TWLPSSTPPPSRPPAWPRPKQAQPRPPAPGTSPPPQRQAETMPTSTRMQTTPPTVRATRPAEGSARRRGPGPPSRRQRPGGARVGLAQIRARAGHELPGTTENDDIVPGVLHVVELVLRHGLGASSPEFIKEHRGRVSTEDPQA